MKKKPTYAKEGNAFTAFMAQIAKENAARRATYARRNGKGFVVRKYDGDDAYSWAVFRAADVKGLRGVIFYGQASPVISDCTRREANYHRSILEAPLPPR
jgi:hypothetical protein